MSNTPILIQERENILYVGSKQIEIDRQMHRNLKIVKFNSFKKIERYITKKEIQEVWFDVSFLSYEKIIDMISEFKHQNVIYKIHSESTDYVIGSNSSDGRGEIIDLIAANYIAVTAI